MRTHFWPFFGLTLLLLIAPRVNAADEKGWITLIGEGKELDAWKSPSDKWGVGGGATLDPKNPRKLVAEEGKGILVNSPPGRLPDLITKELFTDLEAHVEFLIPKGSNSGVKMMGRYEIQIED